MTATEKLRRDVKKQLDNADDRSLRMVRAMLAADAEHDGWDELSDAAKESMERGLKDIEAGRLTPHKEAMKKYKKWL